MKTVTTLLLMTGVMMVMSAVIARIAQWIIGFAVLSSHVWQHGGLLAIKHGGAGSRCLNGL